MKDESLEIAHLTSRNSENASASGGKPPDPPHLLDVVIITHWKDGSLEIAHLTTRNSENASASGGKPLIPSPPHVTNNGKHVQIIKILDFMQILFHRKDRKVGKEIKMLGRGVGRILTWVGEYTPLCSSYNITIIIIQELAVWMGTLESLISVYSKNH